MITFNYRGLNSYTDMGVILKETPPISKPKRRVTSVQIPGRDGELHYDEGTYDSLSLPLVCAVNRDSDEDLVRQAERIMGWLDGPVAPLTFSNNPSKQYMAQATNQIDITNPILALGEFSIMFDCEPFKQDAEEGLIILAAPQSIYNGDAKKGFPVITVYGFGTITLSVNNTSIVLTNVTSDGITVDSLLMDCYTAELLRNDRMTGEFPMFVKGYNNISWVGTVYNVEIQPNWRYS